MKLQMNWARVTEPNNTGEVAPPLIEVKKSFTGVSVLSQMPTKARTTVRILVRMISNFHL